MDTQGWSTYCFGRFLIDLPPAAQVRASYTIRGDRFERTVLRRESFEDAVSRKENELASAAHETEGSMLVRRVDHDTGAVTLISWSHPGRTRMKHEHTFFLTQDGAVYYYGGQLSARRENLVIRNTADYARNLKSLEAGEVPGEPGFCIESGYIAGNEFMGESFRAGITVPGHPGMQLTFRSATGAAENGLLERVGGFFRTEVLGAAVGMNTLRKGQRSLGPIAGEEYLVTGREQQQRVYAFRWEFQGRDGSLAEPNLALEMGVMERDPDAEGNPPARAFSTDAEALQLWDAMLESIRLRPGAV